ncbi:MAG TPA: S41 family peptidase [Bryobacteraceae bacterium]|jgi:carboxyl-terminal processing protease|nr:S41 family peptidase [Bryobacteraceae bacterium]
MPFFALLLFLAAPPQDDPAEQLARDLKKLIDVFSIADREAADPVVPDQAFYQGAIPGMLKTLDPHSIFFDPGQFEQLKQMQKSESKGFGSIVSVLPGRVIVLQAMEGTPSAKSGLQAGDEILAINGYELARLEFDQLVQLLTAARQQEAQLYVRRPGTAHIMRFTLKPELVDSPSVDRAFLLEPQIGYVRVASFEEATGKLTREKIESLGGDNLKGLVLDLRNNPGGSVEAALEIASLFLTPDQLVFSVKGRSTKTEEVRVPKLARPYKFPLAVLINGKSASASEILSGALQDHDRAAILGEPSYGKGLVQRVYTLSSNTGLALTTAFYYTPSGRSIQKPLAFGQLDSTAIAPAGSFHTDSGRDVRGGGGIQPDETAEPPELSRLQIVLDASGSFTTFASEYIAAHEIPPDFNVSPELLDEFRAFLAGRQIQPGVSEFLKDRAWMQSRLKQEIVSLKFGVAKGDEIEMRRDAVVQAAIRKLR